MEKFYITDLYDLLERDPSDGELMPVLASAAEYLGDIVASATAGPAAREAARARRCGMRSGRRRCRGRVMVKWLEVPPEVHWRCPACGSAGVIRNWAGSPWDLRRAAAARADEEIEPDLAEVREFSLTLEEYDVLGEDYFLWEDTSQLILARAGFLDGRVWLAGALGDLDILAGEVAASANHCPDRKREKALLRAFSAIEDALAPPGVAGLGNLAEEILGQSGVIRDFLNAVPAPYRDTFRQEISGQLERQLRTPQEQFAGLTPPQFEMFMNHESLEDFFSPSAALTVADLEKATMIRDIRYFLQCLVDWHPVKATAKQGNLPRKLCQHLIQHIAGDEFIRKYGKLSSENGSPAIGTIRRAARMAGLIRKYKGVFKLTRKGEKFLANPADQVWYKTLFLTLGTKFDWGYYDRYGHYDPLQQALGFILYLLARHGGEFMPAADYTAMVTRALPQLEAEYAACLQEEPFARNMHNIFMLRAVERFLLPFGLVELTGRHRPFDVEDKRRLRRTALFDRLFSINVSKER